MSEPLVRLLGDNIDEFNCGTQRFLKHSDGSFYCSEEVARVMCDGRSGLSRAPTGYTPPKGSIDIAHVAAAIRGLPDGNAKNVLWDALVEAGHSET